MKSKIKLQHSEPTIRCSFGANVYNNIIFKGIGYAISSATAVVGRSFLFILGWKGLSDQIVVPKSTVLVFPHTSYVDFFMLLLYIFSYPKHFVNAKMLMKPQVFDMCKGPMEWLGAIPSTKLEDKNGGAVVRIANCLQGLERFVFMISPKGTIVKSKWRSGYFHIARITGADIRVAGLDYVDKKIVVGDIVPYNYDTKESELQEILKEQMGQIVPLYPEEEVMTIRPHREKDRGIVNIFRLSLILIATISVSLSVRFFQVW